MEIDIDKQRQAQENVRKLIAQEEQQRAERRLLKLVSDLEQGYSDVLLNDELLEKLPGLLSIYCQAGNHSRVQVLFEQLSECACSENPKLRERAIMALSLCLEGLEYREHGTLIKQITSILLRWLRVETVFFSVCATVCRQLQNYGVRMLEEGLWKECDYLLEVLNTIQSGVQAKSNAIRSVVTRAQEGMANDYILEELTLVCLRGRGERRQNAERLLIHLGSKAAAHLLETLLACQKKEDRLRLIGLIPATGYAAVPVLKASLQKDLPWYGIRNVILMITAMDDPELIPLIMPCLEHEDIRIQQQVLDCISEVGGENVGKFLLEALPRVDDELKVGLVGFLGQLGEAKASEVFLDLLAERESFSPNVRDELLQNLAVQVRLSDSIRAVNLLTMLLKERSIQYNPKTDPVYQVASQTLQILKPRFDIQKEPPAETAAPKSAFSSDSESIAGEAVSPNPSKRNIQRINEEISVLVEQGQVIAARKLLYGKCLEAAKEKNFDEAELLRDRILEIDPNALAEVIRAGEKIEEERSSSITSNHISIWQNLYDSLTTEEFNALYYSLEAKEYSAGSVVVEQGENKPCLFFINSGQARLTCLRGNDEVFLKKLGPGEIVGAEPFFEVSVWTVSLTIIEKTNVHVLERKKFLKLLDKYPGLEPCLVDYCLQAEAIPDLLKGSGDDRRKHVRFPVSILVKHTLLDESGQPSMRSFKGEIADISAGGFSFSIRISKKENARLLLGRGITTNIPTEGGKTVDCKGQIVAVRFQSYVDSDYSVHVQFTDLLSENAVQHIVNQQ